MHYVYVLKSVSHPQHYYTGETSDLRQRFKQHNARSSRHTSKYAPWELIWYAGFSDHATALRFEVFLKTASGRQFQKKYLSINPRLSAEGPAKADGDATLEL